MTLFSFLDLQKLLLSYPDGMKVSARVLSIDSIELKLVAMDGKTFLIELPLEAV